MKIVRKAEPSEVVIDGIEYEVLPLEFLRSGQRFIQMKREGDLALYEVRGEMGNVVSYEVVLIKRSKGGVGTIGGKRIEFRAKENYPSDEAFGRLGSCYGGWNYKLALKEFENSLKYCIDSEDDTE